MKEIKSRNRFSRLRLSVFLLIFAAIGGVAIWRSLAAPNPNLPGDLNDDNTVNVTDLSILLSNYGTSNSTADINSDGTVNILDMSILLSHYGQSITQAVPSIPSGLSATAGTGSVALHWTANPTTDQVDNYQVYWTTDSTWNTGINQNLTVAGTSYTVSGLSGGTTYYFRISAHNAAGYGPWGTAISSVPQAGAGGGTTTGVAPPLAPSSYALPSGAVAVSSSSALASALGGSTRDIILENGTYTNGSSMLIGNHRLWARSLGGAVLNFGLQIGGNGSASGGEIHGLKLDISNASTTADNAAIQIWGNTAGQNAGVYDSWIFGHSVLTFGIEDRVTSGFRAQRLIMSDFTSYGVFFETYYPAYYTDSPATMPVVSDINVSNVFRPARGSSNGTAEAGIWAGTGCQCDKIKVRNTGWMGIWTGGNANNGVYSNLDIDNISGTVPGTSSIASYGVYLEHYSRGNIFKNFVFGNSSNTGVKVGFNCEWADPAYTGTNPVAGQSISGCHFNTFQDGTLYTSYRGTQLEDAEKTTVQRIKFVGQTSAAIDDFMTSGSGYTTIWQGLGNDFSGLAAGAVQYTQAH